MKNTLQRYEINQIMQAVLTFLFSDLTLFKCFTSPIKRKRHFIYLLLFLIGWPISKIGYCQHHLSLLAVKLCRKHLSLILNKFCCIQLSPLQRVEVNLTVTRIRAIGANQTNNLRSTVNWFADGQQAHIQFY